MKKGGILILGLIALLLVGGLALASCRAGCEGDGMCSVKEKKGAVCTSEKCGVWAGIIVDKELECDC